MIINADCLDYMRTMQDNSIDAVICDPPYGLGFMGQKWDAGLPMQEIWKEALRIAKPGTHLLAFGGDRTHHHLMVALENAGWEIRTCLYWCFASGFPKSHNFGKKLGSEWAGYGTALKPAAEIIVMAMKPLDGTFAQNAEKWGVAGINIDDSRIGSHDFTQDEWSKKGMSRPTRSTFGKHKPSDSKLPSGRWPANLILDEVAGEMLDQQSGTLKSGAMTSTRNVSGSFSANAKESTAKGFGDSGGASRFFFCAKASSSERNEGCESNGHPCVKPISLMTYLIKLVMPPKGGILLDPFCGSGTTIAAATRLGYEAIGIEKEAEYCEIANARVAHAMQKIEEENRQLSFGF